MSEPNLNQPNPDPATRAGTHHRVDLIGDDEMRLVDNADGTIISVATRPNAAAPWTITHDRDGGIAHTADGRVEAAELMIHNGPEGVAESATGYSTFVPHDVFQKA